MKKMLFLSKNWHFSVQKALIYYTFNKSHHNLYILLVFLHVANFRYVANFRFLTLNVSTCFTFALHLLQVLIFTFALHLLQVVNFTFALHLLQGVNFTFALHLLQVIKSCMCMYLRAWR